MRLPDTRQWSRAALLALVTLVAYLPAWKAGFLWDDDLLLTENRRVQSGSLRELWTYSPETECYPITWTSFWLEWRCWGMNPAGYHVTNILLHTLGALLVWRVLERLGIRGAWWAAMIFAVHPVNVESAAWIAERKNTLSLVFCALTVLAFLRFDDSGRSGWYWGALAAFVAALLSKASAVPLPAVLLLCVWWHRGRLQRRDLLHVAPFVLLAAVAGWLAIGTYQWQSARTETVLSAQRPLGFRLGAAGHVFWFYARKALVPVHLMAVYPLWKFEKLTPLFWVPTLWIAVVAGVAWRFRATWGRSVLFALLYFGIMLLPALGLFNAPYIGRSPVVTDHLQYHAIIGVISLVVAAIMSLPRAVANGIALLLVGTLAALSAKRASRYEDPVQFWTDTLAQNPQAARAHYELALHYDKLGRYDEALKHYAATLQWEPTYYKAHNNIGKVLIRHGRLAEALRHFEAAARLRPGVAELYYNHGLALFLAKRFPEAILELKQAIRYQPRNANAHACLATAYSFVGKTQEARCHFAEAARLNPNHPDFSRLLPP